MCFKNYNVKNVNNIVKTNSIIEFYQAFKIIKHITVLSKTKVFGFTDGDSYLLFEETGYFTFYSGPSTRWSCYLGGI